MSPLQSFAVVHVVLSCFLARIFCPSVDVDCPLWSSCLCTCLTLELAIVDIHVSRKGSGERANIAILAQTIDSESDRELTRKRDCLRGITAWNATNGQSDDG